MLPAAKSRSTNLALKRHKKSHTPAGHGFNRIFQDFFNYSLKATLSA
jgi:hypothetical protein